MSNKNGIEKHCKYLESKIRKKQVKLDELRKENQQLRENVGYLQGLFNELELKYIASIDGCKDLESRLKQRDEVIDDAIYYIKNRQESGIYENHNLLGILQKYKGDNK